MNNGINKFRLRDLRAEFGETTYELAKAIGVSQPTVVQWENGLKSPSRSNLAIFFR